MTDPLKFILLQLTTGFLLGVALAALLMAGNLTPLITITLLEAALFAYGIGSIFAVGYLATALAFDAEK